MIEIQGYRIKETLHEGLRTFVFRAEREADGQGVVLKLLKSEYPGPREVAAL